MTIYEALTKRIEDLQRAASQARGDFAQMWLDHAELLTGVRQDMSTELAGQEYSRAYLSDAIAVHQLAHRVVYGGRE